MKRIPAFLLITITFILIFFTLFASYRWFPQDKVVFEDGRYIMLEGFDIRINNEKKVEYTELPFNLRLKYHDVVTMTTTLKEPYVAGAVLFFQIGQTSVTVNVDGREVYAYGTGRRAFGRAPFRSWHVVELPTDYMGKEVVITQRQLLLPSSIPHTLYPVGLSTKATALVRYILPTYGFLLFLAETMVMVSLGFLVFSLVLMRKDKNARKIFYFFLFTLHVSLWGICYNPMTTLLFGYVCFLYVMTYLLHASIMIPAMLYFGETYHKRYKKAFHGIVYFDLMKLSFLMVSELLTIRSLAENLFIINGVLVAEILFLTAVVLWELVHKNKENHTVIYGLVYLALLGLYEMARLYLFDKTTISNSLYYGMAIMLTAGAINIVNNYFKEVDDLNYLKIQNKETLRLLEIQQGYYQRISDGLHVARQAAHDFNHYKTMIYGAIQSGSTKKLEELLEKTNDIYKNMQMTLYTESLEINAILNSVAESCATQNVKFMPAVRELDCGVNPYDLCIIIGNMLDNAVEGAMAANEERYVTFFTNRDVDKLYIGVENSYSGNLNIVEGKLRTTKQDADNHGLGLSIIEEILKKYNGELWLDGEGTVFKVLVTIPIRN